MFQKITFTNYRIFAGKQELSLAPVTVVFGKNNVGKSALLKLPLLVSNIIANHHEDGELFEKSIKGVRICEDYRDIVYGKGSRAVELSVTDGEYAMNLSFFVESQGRQRTHEEKRDFFQKEISIDRQQVDIKKLLPCEIEYLKAIRKTPKDGYFTVTSFENDVDPEGLFSYRRLVEDELNHSGILLQKISDWYNKTFDGWSVRVETLRAPIYSVTLNHGGIRSNIIDGGAGIAQSLPIMVSAATEALSSRLCIYEEPETHLHPEAHGAIAEFISNEAIESKGKKLFLIETHSVNFVLRLRTLIALGRLQPKDLALYYVDFDTEKEASTLRRIKVNTNGTVEGWPKDVFQETLQEARALREAQFKLEESK